MHPTTKSTGTGPQEKENKCKLGIATADMLNQLTDKRSFLAVPTQAEKPLEDEKPKPKRLLPPPTSNLTSQEIGKNCFTPRHPQFTRPISPRG